MKKISCLFVALCAVVCVSAQWSGDTLTISRSLDDIVVNAPVKQKTDNRTSVDEEDLKKRNTGQNLPFLLEQTPALIVTSDDGLGIGYSYFRLRGTDHTRINVTVNDVPLNEAESQTVFWVNVSDIAESSTKVDIQRGVGSSVNGCAGFGGSVNIETLSSSVNTDSAHLYGEIGINVAMYSTFREYLKLNAFVGNWHLCGRFSKLNSHGYLERAASDMLSYQMEIGWQHRKQGHYTQGTELRLLAFGGREQTYMAWYGISEEQMAVNRRFNPAGMYISESGDTTYFPNQTDNYQQHHLQLHINHRFTPHWTIRATAHYTYGEGKYLLADEAIVKLNDMQLPQWTGIVSKGMYNHYYGGLLAAKYISEAVDVETGGAINDYLGFHPGLLDADTLYLGKGRKTEGNLYVKANWHILHQGPQELSLYGDVQYRMINYRIWGDNDESYESIDIHRIWHFVNPKAGLTYLNHGHRLYGQFAMANREPARTNFTARTMEDPMPKAERLFDYELGYNYSHHNMNQLHSIQDWQLGLNLYFMDYDDQLVLTGRMNSVGAYVTQNVDRSYRLGAELQWTINWTKWFKWSGNLTASLNKWQNDNEEWLAISFSPAWVLHNTFDFHISGFWTMIQTQLVSKQYLDNMQNEKACLKPYTVTNLSLGYQWPNVHISAHVNNVFNSRYVSNGGTYNGYNWYYPQATINVGGGVVVKW
ncbi:MAG: TonB-dependent receptor [Paludibacteraceae bacterium]|nr:TonB-dependent receptor [Paludibacteraceae bacterium]